MIRQLRVPGIMLAAAFAFAACGDSTGPSGNGNARAVMKDDPNSTSGVVVPLETASMQPSAAATGSFSGTFTGDVQVAIQAENGTWVDLGSPQSMSLAMQSSGDSTEVHGNATVPAGTYTKVRLTLDNAQATIDAGSTVGGVSLSAAVDIRVSGSNGGDLVIEKQIGPVTVDADVQTTFVFDFNSETWVTAQSTEDKQADEQEVDNNTTAESRQGPKPE